MQKKTVFSFMAATTFLCQAANAQSTQAPIPSVLDGVAYNSEGKLFLSRAGNAVDLGKKDSYTLSAFSTVPTGAETGLLLDIHQPGFNGTVAYGPLDQEANFPVVAFLPKDVRMTDGKALLEIKKVFARSNDFFKLAEKGSGLLGYRIMDSNGRILYEGRVAFDGKGPYTVVPTLTEGPLVNDLKPTGCTLSFETSMDIPVTVTVGNKSFESAAGRHHELVIEGLTPATDYEYLVSYGSRKDRHRLQTAAAEGSRQAFSFAFASANRATTGGGERDFGGTNYQSTRAIMAQAVAEHAVFMHIQGDITNGANPSDDGHAMEYANFKRSMEPFWGRIPVYVGFGDHEASRQTFAPDPVTKKSKTIEAFPYANASGEASFARAFVNPTNGPGSEDGASYDPNPRQQDFPSYKENVYYYTYGNTAMVVLNTEYWESKDPELTSGCPEGYIMDQQVAWLKATMHQFETDAHIDHIFVVTHGAVFPNGDHLADAMWWNGDNTSRAYVAGKPLSKGAIERRDEILDICVNGSEKFLAFISGDEHNFSMLQVTPSMKMYLPDYPGRRIRLKRNFYCINNGAGGSAPYAMLTSPWSEGFRYFTEPPAIALIHVDGKSVWLSAKRIETLDPICQDVQLR
jgi:hypothetical protein